MSDERDKAGEDIFRAFAIIGAFLTGLGGILLAYFALFGKNENYTGAGLGLLASALAFGLLGVGLSIKK